MITTVLRTTMIYFFVVLVLRLMGKRQIGELEPSELVVTIMVSDLAAMPITDVGTPLLVSLLAILILVILEIFISYFAYRSTKVRTLFYGRPSMFYEHGKLHQKEMRRQRFNVADLMEELRNNGAVSLNEVEYVLMETNGKVSVILKGENSPLTPADLDMRVEPVRMSYVLIDNGNLISGNLKRLGLNDIWLKKTLRENKMNKVKDVFYMSVEKGTGNTVLIPKEKGEER